MVQTELVPGKPKKKSDVQAKGDISGLIGMMGDRILDCISFDEGLVLKIMHQILGEKPDVIDSEVQDRVGEITNMICGGAKN
jgi:chemotaxis protein CheX